MNAHVKFFEFLGQQTNGKDLQDAYKEYKNSSFSLNGHLKAGIGLNTELESLFTRLMKIICARTTTELVVYRMTSRYEFIGPMLNLLERKPIRYQAFLSCSSSAELIHSFTPGSDPLVLKITCPVGTKVALMEASAGAMEDEILLGCGCEFEVGNLKAIEDRSEASAYTGNSPYSGTLHLLTLKVTGNPPYTDKLSHFDF